MNEPETAIACPMPSPAPMIWRWPLFGYALLITVITVLFMPIAFCRQIATAGVEFWNDSGAFCPALVFVGIYSLYCVGLLAKNQLTPLEIDRLQLAEFVAYASGLLGSIIRLVSLSHNATGTLDPVSMLGALAPFKFGISVWVAVVALRWLAEHIVLLKTRKESNEI
jgi:hypothetical protein